jgi:Lon protease-like protein
MLPIFPLSLVVYPGSKYPLHIFEERYKNMVKFSMKLDEPFGIIIFENNTLGRIGTKVKVDSITKNYPDGSFDIIVRGSERFVLKTLNENEIGFFEAEVDSYEDVISGAYRDLENEMIDIFSEVIGKANVELNDNFYFNLEESKMKSFKIAEKAGLSLEQQQSLLTLQNEGERIYFLIEHLKKLSVELDHREQLRQIMQHDGFVN